MGLTWSDEAPQSQPTYGDLERDVFFWSSVVELGLAGIPVNVVGPFKCNLPQLKDELSRVAESESTLYRARVNHKGLHLRSFPLSTTGTDYAMKFLAWSPALAKARLQGVPNKVSEIHFWTNFFDAVRIAVVSQFLHYPSTTGSNFELAYTILDDFAWLPEQVNDINGMSNTDAPPCAATKGIRAVQHKRMVMHADSFL
eukprot:CAMPEP_0198198330 /NCGR_PEP_ID=MMETSP1445-20131203/1815_1 /TAXON_ID=36898 /ORGANISM="Pyramimonas sp., Strain CCMP2087" /LENGTH=198 /DNA_ID=CAMNT_0043867867 /DNA_START=151 /DNA_END=744 /DNA_ORIENTATION=-